MAEASAYRHREAGISSSASKGADSIVLSGGYEDDQDVGALIIYTGYGCGYPATVRQVSDQPFSLWNRALLYNGLNGLPVRVIRGEGRDLPYSPSAGYRYDGLYLVDDYWQDRGRAGFAVWRYKLTSVSTTAHFCVRLDDMSWAKHSHSPVRERTPDLPLDGVMQDAAYGLP